MTKLLKNHNHNTIDATVIADSINDQGDRLTSMVCSFPRIVLSEFNTHRMLSKNSASSRAVPFDKMIEAVKVNPFIPIKWMKDHKGMQGSEYFDMTKYPGLLLEGLWLKARNQAIHFAKKLHAGGNGVTKQIVNRLLEPFKWHTVIVTGYEWENFFALRAEESAEIHIQELAYKMLNAYNKSTPNNLKAGEWHIPFGDDFDQNKLDAIFLHEFGFDSDWSKEEIEEKLQELKIKIAIARCARVSYENFDGTDDYKKDIKLYERLASMGHWSPFEHCARAMTENEYLSYVRGIRAWNGQVSMFPKEALGWCGNFKGFIQARKMHKNENKIDKRVK